MRSIYIAVKVNMEEPIAALTKNELAEKIGVHRNSIKIINGRAYVASWSIFLIPLRERNDNMCRDNWRTNLKQK